MWTKALLLITLAAVALPLALWVGISLGTAWVQEAVLP